MKISGLCLFESPAMIKDAVISNDGTLRYRLTRRWGDGLPLVFIMLNPSTADANNDDQTITKCIGFARLFGFNAIEVVNLFAYRATKPKDLKAAGWPVGESNDAYIASTVFSAGEVVCAWGANAYGMDRPAKVLRNLASMGVMPKCLHITKDGAPGHPLMLSYDSVLRPYEESRAN